MGLLEKEIVNQLLEFSSKEKRDELEPRIVSFLSGDTTTKVTKLSQRRGAADGGIDGRIKVLRTVLNSIEDGKEIEVEAGINVKVRKTPFTREQFGAFINDLDRESLNVGLIITAVGLAPDAQSELQRHNSKGSIQLAHILLEDILSGKVKVENIRFKDGELCETMRCNLHNYLVS